VGRDLGGSAVEIATQLALPIVKFNAASPDDSERDEKQGGYVGSFADLAEAIHQQVAAWKNWDQKRGRHLVLNLSVGWDGEQFGGLTETRVCDLPVGPRAVYLALEYAARQGALTFAAAGNAQSGPRASSGPLLPAGWARGNIQESACGKGLKTPLLYAVGGVQWDGAPITNARRGGMPEFAAYADHVSVRDLEGNPTSTYTGTSVATAIVSSIAARIWHQYPHQSAEQIVDLLRTRGEDLHYRADFYYGANAPNVRQISLCSALGLRCPERSRPALSKFIDEKPNSPSGALSEVNLSPADACGSGIFYQVSNLGTPGTLDAKQVCPWLVVDDYWSEPWVITQPEFDPCPDCRMRAPQQLNVPTGTGDGLLLVEISEKWTSIAKTERTELLSGTLVVEQTDSVGTTRTSYVFKPPTGGASMISLPRSDFRAGASIKANLNWSVTRQDLRTSSINSPVLIFE